MTRHARGAAHAASPEPVAAETPSARERIVAAALQLVQTEGLHALSQGRAASAAGLRQSHVTYYFPTRRHLIQALAEAMHEQMLQAMQAPLLNSKSARRLKQLREFFAARPYDPLLARLMVSLVVTADEDPSVRSWLTNFENNVLTQLRELFAEVGMQCSDDALGLFQAAVVGSCVLASHGNATRVDRSSRTVRLAFDRLVETSTLQSRRRKQSIERSSQRK